jgi:transcriptional regulator with XRE-family HTH domain
MANLYEDLHQARKAKGWTQVELAELMQLGQSYLSQVERGKHDIRANTLIEWARLLDLEVMLVPRQNVPAVSYLIASDDETSEERLPPAYGPLPDAV